MNARNKMFSILGLSLALAGTAVFAQDAATPGRGQDKSKQASGKAKVGEKAPTWTGKDINGKEWKSTDFANKIVVLEWVNPGCPVCKTAHEDGRIPTMLKELKAQGEDVVFVAVNSTADATANSAESNKKALQGYGVDYPVVLDNAGTIGKSFDAKTTPHIFVIDTQGVLRYNGALDNNARGDKSGDQVTNYVVNAVKAIKAGETVTPDTTQPYGCSVKYGKPGNSAAAPGREKKE